VRAQARAALSAAERSLLFGDGAASADTGCSLRGPLAQAEHDTETLAGVLPPLGSRSAV
jgi:hypothetical protein